ncbi:MAG TPA: hypothetical protein VF601_03350 [Beijerinckiaceae bacterium]
MACLGASAVALWAMTCGAEAKKVYYEIDGVRYSYSTNNHQQVREARERINAANAADAAKAKAQAERAANPLAAIFGSPAQSAAKEAETRVRQAVSGEPAAVPEAAAAAESRESRRARREARRERALARAAARKPVVQATAARRPERAPAEAAAKVAVPEPAAAGPQGTDPRASGVKSVFYDLATGIKTVHMADGTVHEELFDPRSLPDAGVAAGADLTDFVNGLRKPTPEDATGALANNLRPKN